MIFINQIFFFFLIPYKIDLIFINQISLFFYLFFIPYKIDLIFVNQISFFSTLQNRFDFSLKRGHIHKTNLLKLILPSVCYMCCNISFNIIQKGIKWSLESRRPNFVYAEWVPFG